MRKITDLTIYIIVAVKMGIMDNVLCPHLKAVTEAFTQNKDGWLSMLETIENDEIKSEQKAELNLSKEKRNQAAESFREKGNKFFLSQDFNQALLMYTQSIAAAIEGPLASLAYFNRLIPYKSYIIYYAYMSYSIIEYNM